MTTNVANNYEAHKDLTLRAGKRTRQHPTIQPGMRFGDLLTVEAIGKDKAGKVRWLCTCACGGCTVIINTNLNSGNTKTCGNRKAHPAAKRTRTRIESGERFGLLVTTERAATGRDGSRHWHCRCDCQRQTTVSASNLRAGFTRSCGDSSHRRNTVESMTYSGAHTRVRDARGAARDYPCIFCGKTAHDWSLMHSDPEADADTDGKEFGRAFSADPNHYQPMCRGHHAKFDTAHGRLPLNGSLSLAHVVLQAVIANAEDAA